MLNDILHQKVMQSLDKQQGFAVLFTTVILLIITGIATLYTAHQVAMEQKVAGYNYQTKQAFEAAQAGVEYGAAYFQQNRTSILVDSNSDGTPDSFNPPAPTRITLDPACGSCAYQITYTLPVAGNFNLLKISSQGWSSDGTATTTVSSRFQYVSSVTFSPKAALTAKGSISLGGSSQAVNTSSPNQITLRSGGTVSLSGSAETLKQNSSNATVVGSTSAGINSDVTQNDTSLSSMTSEQYFTSFFGMSEAAVKDSVDYYYTNANVDLNGKQGISIFVEVSSGTLQINGNTTIGSPTNPVLLIVKGPLRINGNTTIYGLLYVDDVIWDNSGSGNTTIYGAVISSGSVSMTGNPTLNYSPTVLTKVHSFGGAYAKVPGSWRDF